MQETTASQLTPGVLRCCPYELAALRQTISLPLYEFPEQELLPLEGSMRHAMLLCGHPEVTRARESMFDAAETIVAPAL